MLKDHKFYLNITWLILLFTIPLPLVITLSTGISSLFSTDIMAINFGVFAYVWMLVAIYLATKPRWLDKLIGLPDMYLIHGVTTIFALGLMYLHDNALDSGGLIETTGEFSLYLITFLIAYSLIFMAGWLTSRISLLLTIKKTLEKIFKHEISVWIHRLNILAVFVIYIHIVLIDYINSITPFFVLVTIYTFFTFGNYFFFVYKRAKNNNVGKVLRAELIDKNIVELDIALSKKALGKINAGDFVYISFPNRKNMHEPHPFSIVNVPSRDGYIRLGVEAVGDFTRGLKYIKENDKALVTNGFGVLNNIVKKSAPNEKFVLIGGGIGVTSLASLADNFAEKDITFFYTVKQDKAILYKDKFLEWQHRNNFRAIIQKGRFSKEQLNTNMPLGEDYSYIIAGPMAMNVAYTKYLKSKGIHGNKIFFESFNF